MQSIENLGFAKNWRGLLDIDVAELVLQMSCINQIADQNSNSKFKIQNFYFNSILTNEVTKHEDAWYASSQLLLE